MNHNTRVDLRQRPDGKWVLWAKEIDWAYKLNQEKRNNRGYPHIPYVRCWQAIEVGTFEQVDKVRRAIKSRVSHGEQT